MGASSHCNGNKRLFPVYPCEEIARRARVSVGTDLGRRRLLRRLARLRGPLGRHAEVLPAAVVGEVALRAERLEADLAVQRVQLFARGGGDLLRAGGDSNHVVACTSGSFLFDICQQGIKCP